MVSFHIVPGPKGIEQAEHRLRDLGLTQLKPSRDGQTLQVAAPKAQVERALGVQLVKRRRQVQVGPTKRMVICTEMAEGASIPDHLRDVIAEIIFPVPAEYYSPAPPMR